MCAKYNAICIVDLMSGGRKSRLPLFRREREKMKNGKETEAELAVACLFCLSETNLLSCKRHRGSPLTNWGARGRSGGERVCNDTHIDSF